MEDGPGWRLEALLRELREQLGEGQRRLEAALLELGATSPPSAASPQAQLPPAGGSRAEPPRRASSGKATTAASSPLDATPALASRSGHTADYALATSTDGQEGQEEALGEEFAAALPGPSGAAAPSAPRRSASLSSLSRSARRDRPVRRENTRCSSGEATSAMDMIGHDTVRSYDLRGLWRSMLHSHMTGQGSGTTMMSRTLTRLLSGTSPSSRLRQRALELINSATYELVMLALIFSNSVFLGWQVQHEAKNRAELPWNLHIEAFFCAVFLLELVLKVYAMGPQFALGKERSWNMFDMTVVMSMLVDFLSTVTKQADSGMWSQVSSLRIFRAVRVIRFLRAVRVLKFFTQLRIMLRSIMFSVRPLLWASVVLAAMFYVFGICLTQGVVDYMNETHSWDDPSMDHMRHYFGSLEKSALSLFESMSGGVNWGDLYDSLIPLGLQFQSVFLFFVLFAIFGAANVVTGIFVEIANHWSRFDTHTQIQAEVEQKVFYIRALQDLFSELDTNGSGFLTLENMQDAIHDANIVNSFHALNLELMDVRTLFLLLDRDRKGYISIEEFLLGCFRLKGEAKTLDVIKLQYQSEWIMHNVVKVLDAVSDRTNVSVALRSGAPSSDTSDSGEAPLPKPRKSLFRSLSRAERHEQWRELVGQQPASEFSFFEG